MEWVAVRLIVNGPRGRMGAVVQVPAVTAALMVADGRAEYAGTTGQQIRAIVAEIARHGGVDDVFGRVPDDDEPLTQDDMKAIEEARAEIAAGKVLTWSECQNLVFQECSQERS